MRVDVRCPWQTLPRALCSVEHDLANNTSLQRPTDIYTGLFPLIDQIKKENINKAISMMRGKSPPFELLEIIKSNNYLRF